MTWRCHYSSSSSVFFPFLCSLFGNNLHRDHLFVYRFFLLCVVFWTNFKRAHHRSSLEYYCYTFMCFNGDTFVVVIVRILPYFFFHSLNTLYDDVFLCWRRTRICIPSIGFRFKQDHFCKRNGFIWIVCVCEKEREIERWPANKCNRVMHIHSPDIIIVCKCFFFIFLLIKSNKI